MNKALVINNFISNEGLPFEIYNGNFTNEIKKSINDILSINIEDLLFAIEVRDDFDLLSKQIPMYSDFEDCTSNLCYILDSLNNVGVDMIELGKYFRKSVSNDVALYKYGETHAKAATILGLTKIVKTNKKVKVYLTNLGYYYLSNTNKRNELLTRLLLHSEIIRKIVKNCYCEVYDVSDCLETLSIKTIIRRMPNIKGFALKLLDSNEYNFVPLVNNMNFDYGDLKNEL